MITVWFPTETARLSLGLIQADDLFKRGCEKKRAYKKRSKALKDLDHFMRNHPAAAKALHSYRCQFCGKWHLGHRR